MSAFKKGRQAVIEWIGKLVAGLGQIADKGQILEPENATKGQKFATGLINYGLKNPVGPVQIAGGAAPNMATGAMQTPAREMPGVNLPQMNEQQILGSIMGRMGGI